MTDDAAQLRRQLDALVRAASRIRTHTADLHSLAWEPAVSGSEPVAASRVDYAPRTGPEAVLGFYRHLSERITAIEAEMIGLERRMTALFFAHSSSPEPSRGSTISAEEHARQLGRQRARGDAPARLVDQPAHPGKGR